VTSVPVCVLICLSASISPEQHVQFSPEFCTWVVHVPPGTLCAPGSWMTSYLHIMAGNGRLKKANTVTHRGGGSTVRTPRQIHTYGTQTGPLARTDWGAELDRLSTTALSTLLRRGKVYVTIRCPSVCPSCRPLHQRVVGLLPWARRTGDIDRLLHGRPAPSSKGAAAATASSVTFTAAVEGWTQTCSVLLCIYTVESVP